MVQATPSLPQPLLFFSSLSVTSGQLDRRLLGLEGLGKGIRRQGNWGARLLIGCDLSKSLTCLSLHFLFAKMGTSGCLPGSPVVRMKQVPRPFVKATGGQIT